MTTVATTADVADENNDITDEATSDPLFVDDNGELPNLFYVCEETHAELNNLHELRLDDTPCFFNAPHAGLKRIADRLKDRVPIYREWPFLVSSYRTKVTPSVYDVTVLGCNERATKVIAKIGAKWHTVERAPNSSLHQIAVANVETHDEWQTLLRNMADVSNVCIIRGGLFSKSPFHYSYRRLKTPRTDGKQGWFKDMPYGWVSLDIDDLPLANGLTYDDPGAIVKWLMEEKMPECFRGVSCTWHVSSSGGTTSTTGANFHLFVFLKHPTFTHDLFQLFQRDRETYGAIDPMACRVVQPCFTANPVIRKDSWDKKDPMKGRRVGFYQGTRDTADVSGVIAASVAAIAAENAAKDAKRQARLDKAIATAPNEKARKQLRTEGLPARTDGRYLSTWKIIARDDMGTSNGHGYNGPIFSLLKVALRSGERDGFAIIDHVQSFVPEVARRHGDHATYAGKFVTYLDTSDLRRRLDEAAEIISEKDGTNVFVDYSNGGDA